MRRRTTLLALTALAVGVATTAWMWKAEAPAPSREGGFAPSPLTPGSPPPALAGRLPRAIREERPSEPGKRDTGDPEGPPDGAPVGEVDPLVAGEIVSGRVVDPQGRPLAGIPVYVALATRKGYVLSDQRFLWVDGPDADGGRATAREYGSSSVTDASGAFRVDAFFTRGISSGDGRVRVVPAHPAWMEPRIVTGEEGGEIQAEPAASLTVRVVDEHGVAVPEFRAVVRETGRGEEHEVAATNGGFVVQWRRREGVPDEIRASVAVWARGRALERREVAIPAGREADSLTLELGPVRPDGRLVLRPPATLEADAVRGVVVVLALADRPDGELLRVRMTPSDASRHDAFTADLPPGRFRVRAFVIEPSREGWIVDETIEISTGTTTERTWAPADPAPR